MKTRIGRLVEIVTAAAVCIALIAGVAVCFVYFPVWVLVIVIAALCFMLIYSIIDDKKSRNHHEMHKM